MAKRVVWILGSGFSKSLGGPLLDDLLSDSRWLRLNHTSIPKPTGGDWTALLTNAKRILNEFNGKTGAAIPGPWTNAEEFIEMLDAGYDHFGQANSLERELAARSGRAGDEEIHRGDHA